MEQRIRVAMLAATLETEVPPWFNREMAIKASLARIEKIVSWVTEWRLALRKDMPTPGQGEAPR